MSLDEQQLREADALVDGLVIGHFLTRDHYRERVDALEGELDGLRSDKEHWFDDRSGPGTDDPLDDLDRDLDYAEFDAMAGFGVEPWADELFDAGDEDED